ncbi:MAG: Maf family protein [Promethearchaeota archaeon]
MKKIVLASKSIDRCEIFKRAKIPFEIIVSNIDEDAYKAKIEDPIELVKELAKAKALNVKDLLINQNKNSIIIAADTIVEINDGEIIGKAKDEEQAFQILKKLAGKIHNLITGFAITETNIPKIIVDYETTSVKFLNLSNEEIWDYIKSGEWKGRAGAYSIREKASLFIESIQGSSSNIIGLPMHKVYEILKNEFNLDLLQI